ncbi:ribonuclease HII [Wenzhouxiangella sp. XN24]|uniref:ribonuclease HII n=1 Tax=Wenzhouxiangella sp. XN24 TaxID=2713569 RepID=UPI0013ED8B47|nr:ribonuclease HII [Wenzhouxiangella sp. XN24]NGX15330.1 ribonuclease HII [Wenzhouxiangella sp. XN24]
MSATLPLPKFPNLKLEREIEGRVCGVDEAGCAPLAGPVVAAAVLLPSGARPRQLRGLNDSKLLSAAERERLFTAIQRVGGVAVGMATVAEIDQLNIFHADMLAMQRAVEALGEVPDLALVDGRGTPALRCRVRTVIKGDRRSLSIAAASVVAKVVRDRLMHTLAEDYPDYGWQTNVGYGTDTHYLGLLRKGPTEHHRRSFAPLNTLFSSDDRSLRAFRFRAMRGRPDLSGLRLLQLRQDLHAVFDGGDHHLGVLKNLRGRWTFQAIGYDDEGRLLKGGGPCAGCHGLRLAGPDGMVLAELLVAGLS